MKVVIAEIAKEEFHAAKEYYEIEHIGLGRRFAKEIRKSILCI